jgi:hypothetical protein
MVKPDSEYLFKQVFSIVVLALLTITFYLLAIGGMAGGVENTLSLMLLTIIAIILVSIMSELAKLTHMLSRRK